jgi:DNA-binding MarR family transcriptional regulator
MPIMPPIADDSIDARALGNPATHQFRLENYPFFQLNRLVSRYNTLLEARLRAVGIDIPYWRVLLILGENAPRSVGAIAETAIINVSTMMRIVQRMERDALVECRASPYDGRVTKVYLTSVGQTKLDAARASAAPVFASLIKGFSEKDFLQLLNLLSRLQSNLDKHIES